MSMKREEVHFGSQKIMKEAIVQDIRALMLLYQKKKSTSFHVFRQVWDSLDFSLIHYGCCDRAARKIFMEYLYNTSLSYLLVAFNIQSKISVLYALFMLYKTQPSSLPKHPIPVTLSIWLELKEIYAEICRENILEAAYIYYKMRVEFMFVLVAAVSNPTSDSVGEFFNATNRKKEANDKTELEIVRLSERVDEHFLESFDLNWGLFEKTERSYEAFKESTELIECDGGEGEQFSVLLKKCLEEKKAEQASKNLETIPEVSSQTPSRRHQLRALSYANRSYTPTLSKKRSQQ